MIQLKFKLDQHTPMLHFQPAQQGATLRATEVKPRFDKWLVRKAWSDDYSRCKKFLVGYSPADDLDLQKKFNDGYRALNYKMRITPVNDLTRYVAMKQFPAQSHGAPVLDDMTGIQKETTQTYPSRNQSVVMSNIGGRLPEDVVNFSLYEYLEVTLTLDDRDLAKALKENFEEFLLMTNFGNRKSKGFGSFVMSENNGKVINDLYMPAPWVIYMTITSDRKAIIPEKAYRDLFTVINKLWRKLKSHYRGPRSSNRSVLLGQDCRDIGTPPRIPSPIIFKPIVLDRTKDKWEIAIELLYDSEVVSEACIAGTDKVYDGYVNDLNEYLEGVDLVKFAHDLSLNYSLDELIIE